MAIYKFKIVRVEDKKSKTGNTFRTYKTVTKSGNFMDVKFVKTCQNVPTERCVITVNEDDWNVDDQREFPILWIKNVQAIEPIQASAPKKNEYFDPES